VIRGEQPMHARWWEGEQLQLYTALI